MIGLVKAMCANRTIVVRSLLPYKVWRRRVDMVDRRNQLQLTSSFIFARKCIYASNVVWLFYLSKILSSPATSSSQACKFSINFLSVIPKQLIKSIFLPCPLSSEVDYSITELGNVVKSERIKAENHEGKNMWKKLLKPLLSGLGIGGSKTDHCTKDKSKCDDNL